MPDRRRSNDQGDLESKLTLNCRRRRWAVWLSMPGDPSSRLRASLSSSWGGRCIPMSTRHGPSSGSHWSTYEARPPQPPQVEVPRAQVRPRREGEIVLKGRQELGVLIKIVEYSRHYTCSLFRRGELAYPVHVSSRGGGRAIKPLIGSPVLAAEDVRQSEIVGVIDRPLVEST